MDKLLKEFFSKERWSYAIEKGVGKDICKAELERLTTPEERLRIKMAMSGQLDQPYRIYPPHTALIPKQDSEEMRTVYVLRPVDRIITSIFNDMLFDLCPDMVHPSCYSYRKGVGCGKVVKKISSEITMHPEHKWWKGDLRHYFDDVQRHRIMWVFDEVERRHGHSAIVEVMRDFYNTDIYFDTNLGEWITEDYTDEHGELHPVYRGLKQGCSVASFLADAALYDMDRRISELDVTYYRYCDDFVLGGRQAEEGMAIIIEELSKVGVSLHPKKLETLSPDKWFKFLGFSIKGKRITMSKSRFEKFVRNVRDLTIDYEFRRRKAGKSFSQDLTPEQRLSDSIRRVNRFLYVGDGRFSWATSVLPIINVQEDIDIMNMYIMDCHRAVFTGKKRIGGIGFQPTQKDHCAIRYKGQNNGMNRKRLFRIPGYTTIRCMQNAIQTSKDAYDLLVREMQFAQ